MQVDEQKHKENGRGWEATVHPVPATTFPSAVDSAEIVRQGPPLEDTDKPADEQAYIDVSGEIDAQVAAAREAVKAVVASGVFGTQEITASLKGFSNPGNEPIEGHPADHITISVGAIAPVSPELQAEIAAAEGAGE